jgi:uncharacterized membrane protein
VTGEKSESGGNRAPSTTPAIPAWLIWVRALLAVAVVGAGYLAWVSIHNGPVVGCGPESGCNKVLQSRWAYWLGIPVSVPALLVYLALMGATVLLRKRTAPDDERGSWAAIIALAVIVAGAALWFVGLQVFVIKAYCKFCMTAHACGLAAALICLRHIPLAVDPDTPMWSSGSGKRGVPRSGVLSIMLVGLAGVAVLAAGQLLVQKERNVVKDLRAGIAQPGKRPVRPGTPGGTDYLAQAAAVAARYSVGPPPPHPQMIAPRVWSLYSNDFVLKLDALPMMGPPAASNVIICLFDYTCPHCRLLHPILLDTQRLFSNRLGIVCLPMPISTNCNPFLPQYAHSVSNACEYARLGLAVWRANPAAHRQFEEWMFADPRPAPLEQAQQYAAQLVGTEKLQAAAADKWVAEQLATDCRLHRTNWTVAETPALPQLILGDAVSSGPLNSVEHLLILLNRYLGLTPPAGNRQ